jgi:hypothetical protein
LKDPVINCACSRKHWDLRQLKQSTDGNFVVENRQDVR